MECVTEKAIADWEEEKERRRRALPSNASQPASLDTDSEPVRPPYRRAQNSKHRRKSSESRAGESPRPRKKQKTDQPAPRANASHDDSDEDTTWKFASQLPRSHGALTVEVPANPNFNPADFTPVDQSSSPKYPSQTQTTDISENRSPRRKGGISQSTIADSQALTDSLPLHIAASGGIAEELIGLGEEEEEAPAPTPVPFQSSNLPFPRLSFGNNSAPPEIPPTTVEQPTTEERQPRRRRSKESARGGGFVPRKDPVPSQRFQARPGSEPSFPATFGAGQAITQESAGASDFVLPAESTFDLKSQHLSSGQSPHRSRFLSQPEFSLDLPAASSSKPSDKTASQNSASCLITSGPANPQSQASPSVILDTSPYSAQVVQPLAGTLGGIRTQSTENQTVPNLNFSANSPQQPPPWTPVLRAPAEIEEHRQKTRTPTPRPRPSDSGSDSQALGETTCDSPILESIEKNSDVEGEVNEDGNPRATPSRRPWPSSAVGASSIFGSDQFLLPSPRTPRSASMDHSSGPNTPLSAVERFRRLRAEIYGEPASQPPNPNTPPEPTDDQRPENPQTPALLPEAAVPSKPTTLPSEPRADDTDRNPPPNNTTAPPVTIPVTSSNAPQETPPAGAVARSPREGQVDQSFAELAASPAVAPQEIATSGRPSSTDDDIPPGPDTSLPDAAPGEGRHHGPFSGVDSQQYPADADPESPPSSIVRPIGGAYNEYIVTLLMAASTRSEYLKTLRSNRSTMVAFGDFFNSDTPTIPGRALTAKMDALFQNLLDFCDLPASARALPEMTSGDMMKHATGTNSKFSFMYEFFELIRGFDSQVLLVARPGLVLEYIEAVLSTAGLNYKRFGEGFAADGSEGLHVVLAGSDQDISKTQASFDLAILFDSSARGVNIPPAFRTGDNRPAILSLVATCSIEHIDLRPSENMDPLERRNAINFALVASQGLVSDPTPTGFMEPHEVAQQFAGLLRDPDLVLDWEPQAIPDELFDIYLSSQPPVGESFDAGADLRAADKPVKPNSRKRLLVGHDKGFSV